MASYVMGVDNGGTVTKAAIYDLQGCEIAVASRQTTLLTPKPGYTERDMDQLWEANLGCIREVVEKSGVDSREILGVAVGGHGKGMYLWGKDGRPAYPGIVSTDNRAWEYPAKWRQDGTFAALYPQLCQQLIPSQQVSLLAWLKEHDRTAYDQAQWVFSVKDYIRFRLTGEAFCEATDISGSGLMDVRNACFDKALLERLGIGEVFEKLAPIRYSSDLCGAITPEVARLTGLPEGTPVAGGMFDIDACAIAMDITTPEKICTITGTWSINEYISTEPVLGTQIAMNSLFAIPGYYLIEECSPTSAGNLEWMLQNCLANEIIPEGKKFYQHLDDLVESIDPGECEVYFLPFLYGSNAHTHAKGTLIGMTTFHQKAHLLRAVYEGVAFSHKSHIDKLLSVRSAPTAIRIAGGAANSSVWVQIFADTLGLPIETVHGVRELGALGCAMAAAVAAGAYRDYQEAALHMVKVNPPVQPDPAHCQVMQRKYARYRSIVSALDPVWNEWTN